MANMANIIALINERLGRLESATQNQGQVNVDIGEMKLKKSSIAEKMKMMESGVATLKLHLQNAVEVQERLDEFLILLKDYMLNGENFDETEFENEFTE